MARDNTVNPKIINAQEWSTLKEATANQKIVFTNGCFDILHYGHICYLQEARSKGDLLIVGVNSDASVARLKGDTRPINKLEHRMAFLAALESVDHVMPFSEDTPITLIKTINPNVLVKGGDYELDQIVGADHVTSYGGQVEVIDYVDGFSTTSIIDKLNSQRKS